MCVWGGGVKDGKISFGFSWVKRGDGRQVCVCVCVFQNKYDHKMKTIKMFSQCIFFLYLCVCPYSRLLLSLSLRLAPPSTPFFFLFFLADPQGYIMSGHLIRPSLDAECVVPHIFKPNTVYCRPAVTYSGFVQSLLQTQL